MARRDLNPKLRQILMQGALVLVLVGALGLAAVVTRKVRLSLRAELAEPRTFGRLKVRLPVKWVAGVSAVEKGDAVDAEEPPPADQPGRRLHIARQRSGGLISPLEHLVRSGQVKVEAVKAAAEGRDGYALTNVSVGGWPGQMLTLVTAPRVGMALKELVACATLPGRQALVVRLEGAGPVDASDRELVRQMCETVTIAMQGPAPDGGGTVELVDDVGLDAPSDYLIVDAEDPNELRRHLVSDGSRDGVWVGVELVSCVFFADEGPDALGAMLAARDADWRSGPVRKLGPRTFAVDRVDPTGRDFPSRAYLTAHTDGRALLVVMRGGPGNQRAFDGVWQSVGASVRFDGNKDLSALLVNGAEAARGAPAALVRRASDDAGRQTWWLLDQSENTEQEVGWTAQWAWGERREGPEALVGTRTSKPGDPYADDTQFEQRWAASPDLARYRVTTNREVRRGGGFPRQTLEQSVTVDAGRVVIGSPAHGVARVELAVPAQYVPGTVLPLIMRELADRPALVRTESFVGAETVAPPGLLTLFVTRLTDAPLRRDERGEPMECVSVSVNGSGVVSRWYYGQDQVLRFIDFAGGVKAQPGPGAK